MRKHLILIAPIFTFFLVLSGGCSSTRSQQTTLKTSTMLQGQYTVEDVNKRGIIDYSQLTLRVNGNQVSGSTGCNHFTGSIESQRDALHISQLAVTRKLCPEALMHQEQQYISSLETVNTLSINTPYILLQNSNNDNVQVKLLKTSHASSLQPKRQDASAGVTHLFQCEDIGMISMMFVGPETITLTTATTSQTLHRERSASGAKYRHGDMVFWNKGQQGIYREQDHTYQCVSV